MKAFLVASLPFASAVDSPLWSQFKTEHGKVYDSTEDEHRFSVFEANMKFIQDENAKGNDFELAVNQFADLTHDEFVAYRMGFRGSQAAVRDDEASLGVHEWRGEALPASVDWSEQGAVTPVKDQGQCGSCWSFSAVGALEGAAKVAKGSLQMFSEQQFVDCDTVADAGCKGGMMDNAFTWAKTNDLCSADSYKYEGAGGECRAKGCKVALDAGAVTGLVDVGHKVEDLMSALAQQPVSVAIEADLPTFQFYKKGVFGSACGGKLDHGVLAVGYGELDGKPYWKVKNSWGSSWGADGYILLSRGQSLMKRTGQCGILKMASYPTVRASSVV